MQLAVVPASAAQMSALSAVASKSSANVGAQPAHEQLLGHSALICGPCSGSSSASWTGCGRWTSG